MRILGVVLFLAGSFALYLGFGMLLLFSGEANPATAGFVKGAIALAGLLMLVAAGWLWHNAKQSDLALCASDPERTIAKTANWRDLGLKLATTVLSGFILVVLVFFVASLR